MHKYVIGWVLLLSVILNSNCYAQTANALSVGMTTGYRYDNSSLYLEYGISSATAVSAEYFVSKYGGNGWAVGGYYYYWSDNNNKVRLFAGLGLARSFGSGFSIGWSGDGGDKNTFFDVSEATYLMPTAGIRYNLSGYAQEMEYKRFCSFSLFLRVGYRTPIGHEAEAAYVSGDPYPAKVNQIQQQVGQGIGFSVGFGIHIGKKVKM